MGPLARCPPVLIVDIVAVKGEIEQDVGLFAFAGFSLKATAAMLLAEEDDGWNKRSSMAPKANGRDFIVVAVMVLSPKNYVMLKDEESGRGKPEIGDAFHFFHL
jgi:hypothetical protein